MHRQLTLRSNPCWRLLAGLAIWFAASCPLVAEEAIRADLRTTLEPTMDWAEGWQAPPLPARTRCWWWWLNGNVTKEAITRDLEAMHAKGLGGANIIDAGGAEQRDNLPVPHGPDFASPAWRELFIHALREADRLGLELGLNIQSGWNLGGPTVTPERAAKKLAIRRLEVDGGQTIRQRLRRPRVVEDYFIDVALLAVPLPANGDAKLARIDNYRAKAYFEYPGSFTAGDASHLLDVTPMEDGAVAVSPETVLDISSALGADGELTWDAPPGRWLLLRFGYTLSGAEVSTHSDGWEGWAIDYLDASAFEWYWGEIVKPLLDEAGPLAGRSLQFLHTDSWELGPVNWTPRLPEQFRRLRGYELATYLPALAGYVVKDPDTSNRFLNDFRRTLADLIAEGKYAAFAKHAHERGLGIHPESGGPHAAPIDALQCLGLSDIPMGEFWARSRTHRIRDFERLFVKQSSSAAHIYGRRLVMAEAFTSIGPQWEEDPASLKPVFDRVACEGLNLVMLHTFDCSPPSMGVPGQAYFAGTHINPNVTWWRHADAFFAYLNRCQFLLQQGLPVSDVLYFYGENIPNFVRLKREDPAGVVPGYDYDVINAEAIIGRTRVEDGRIVLPDGVSYEVLVLPKGNCYGLAALRQIARLVDEGAMVVGEKPSRPIGLSATVEDECEFLELADRLWSKPASGRRVLPAAATDVLKSAGIPPDFEYPASDNEVQGERAQDDAQDGGVLIDYFHRRSTVGDIYFVVNRRDAEATFEGSFRVMQRAPELWDPVSGEVKDAAAFTQDNGRTTIPLTLPPNGSVFVIFRRDVAADAAGSQVANVAPLTAVVQVEGPWSVAFDPKWGGPPKVQFAVLQDWTERPEQGVRYYSGTAVYEATFDVPADALSPQPEGARVHLDLGRVENVAAVTLNGVELGVAWTEPFRVDATKALRPGQNTLSIQVTNLWPNRLIGDRRLPRQERLTSTNITKFRRSSPLLPSGLFGPVTLLREAALGGAAGARGTASAAKTEAGASGE